MRHTFATIVLVVASINCTNAAPTLREAVEQAARRNPDIQGLKARIEEARARGLSARSLTPAPPALTVGARRDNLLLDQQRGTREYEVEIEVPLWLPGQRAAAGANARTLEVAYAAGAEASRLLVAGEVREQAWAVALERAELAAARRRMETALAVESLVAKRLKAGDVARGDLLQAQDEVLAARGVVADSEFGVRRTLAIFAALTGFEEIPASIEEPIAGKADLDRHPRFLAMTAAAENARTVVHAANEFRRDPPSLLLQNRGDRSTTTSYQNENTIRLNVRIPFATDARNLPRIASAQADLTQALAQAQRERAQLEAAVQSATAALDTTRLQVEIAQSRDRLTQEALRLARRGFELGETPFVSVLLTLARAVDSDRVLARARVALGLAEARFNQAAGVLP